MDVINHDISTTSLMPAYNMVHSPSYRYQYGLRWQSVQKNSLPGISLNMAGVSSSALTGGGHHIDTNPLRLHPSLPARPPEKRSGYSRWPGFDYRPGKSVNLTICRQSLTASLLPDSHQDGAIQADGDTLKAGHQ